LQSLLQCVKAFECLKLMTNFQNATSSVCMKTDAPGATIVPKGFRSLQNLPCATLGTEKTSVAFKLQRARRASTSLFTKRWDSISVDLASAARGHYSKNH
jgi:hypothetical protein